MRVSEDFLWQKLGEREDDNDLIEIRNFVIETMITLLSTRNYINVEYNPFAYYLSVLEKKRPGFSKVFIDSLVHNMLNFKLNIGVPFAGNIPSYFNDLRQSFARNCSYVLALCISREHEVDKIANGMERDFFLHQVMFSFKYNEEQQDKENLATEEAERESQSNAYDFVNDHLAKNLSLEKDEKKLDLWLLYFLEYIRNHYDSEMTIMPFSLAKPENFHEILYNFTRLVHLCPRLRKKIILDDKIASINYVIIYYLVKSFYK